jgi:hypothetical protein
MYYHEDDEELFRRTMPKWVRRLAYLSLSGFLPLAVSILVPRIVPNILTMLGVLLGMVGLGVASAVLMSHGVSMGYLPGRFHVSRGHNCVQFWLTIVVMLCFALLFVFYGVSGLVAFASHWAPI